MRAGPGVRAAMVLAAGFLLAPSALAAQDLRVYLANQSLGDLALSNAGPEGGVLMGPLEPGVGAGLLTLPPGGVWRIIPSGHSVYLEFQAVPETTRAVPFRLRQGQALLGTLTYTVTMPGAVPRLDLEVEGAGRFERVDEDLLLFYGEANGVVEE